LPENILVTGAAGFIGFHTSKKLLQEETKVVGLDNLNDYYSPELKKDRLKILEKFKDFSFIKGDLADQQLIEEVFSKYEPDVVINLAAQAGVRHSLKQPRTYMDSNLVGFVNILEGCRHNNVEHLIFASSSSVYGANEKVPFATSDNVDHPVSLYAATKKSNELLAHSYSHLYNLSATGLRFFTVYGPWGRPDMALFIFTRKMLAGEPIEVFNYGDMQRDFTYVDDVVEGIYKLCFQPAKPDPDWDGKEPDPGTSKAPYRIYNIGNNSPVNLMDFIERIEDELDIEADKDFKPMQPGDVQVTYADVEDLVQDVGYQPDTSLEVGIKKFIDWYQDYYGV